MLNHRWHNISAVRLQYLSCIPPGSGHLTHWCQAEVNTNVQEHIPGKDILHNLLPRQHNCRKEIIMSNVVRCCLGNRSYFSSSIELPHNIKSTLYLLHTHF